MLLYYFYITKKNILFQKPISKVIYNISPAPDRPLSKYIECTTEHVPAEYGPGPFLWLATTA